LNYILLLIVAAFSSLQTGTAVFSATVKDMEGKPYQLAQLKKNSGSILVFISPDCPLCQNYALTLNQQQEKFAAKNIKYYGIVSGKSYTQQEINHYKKLFGVKFTILIDDGYLLRDKLKATVVPEAFLLDKNGKVRYSGRIDDWAYEVGKHKTQASEHNLRDAVSNFTQNKPIKITKTKAVGCILE
jgi:peroxiredoxin